MISRPLLWRMVFTTQRFGINFIILFVCPDEPAYCLSTKFGWKCRITSMVGKNIRTNYKRLYPLTRLENGRACGMPPPFYEKNDENIHPLGPITPQSLSKTGSGLHKRIKWVRTRSKIQIAFMFFRNCPIVLIVTARCGGDDSGRCFPFNRYRILSRIEWYSNRSKHKFLIFIRKRISSIGKIWNDLYSEIHSSWDS